MRIRRGEIPSVAKAKSIFLPLAAPLKSRALSKQRIFQHPLHPASLSSAFGPAMPFREYVLFPVSIFTDL
jgi:hypothetical protein